MPAMNHWMSPLSLRISSLLGILGNIRECPCFPYFPLLAQHFQEITTPEGG